jgi:hypothetical protein
MAIGNTHFFFGLKLNKNKNLNNKTCYTLSKYCNDPNVLNDHNIVNSPKVVNGPNIVNSSNVVNCPNVVNGPNVVNCNVFRSVMTLPFRLHWLQAFIGKQTFS